MTRVSVRVDRIRVAGLRLDTSRLREDLREALISQLKPDNHRGAAAPDHTNRSDGDVRLRLPKGAESKQVVSALSHAISKRIVR